MDKRFVIVSLMLGVAANVAYALLLRIVEVPRSVQTSLMIVLLLILPFLVLHLRHFWRRGLVNIWDAKDEKFNLLNQIHESKRSLFFLGVSARTIMQPQIEAALMQKLLTNHEYEVRFLLFDRSETRKLRRRALEETGNPDAANEWATAMGSTIEMILRIKKTLARAGDRLQVRTYRSFPVFRMLIIDNRYVLMNYYAKDRFPAELPCLETGAPGNPSSFGYAFAKYFEEMWSEAQETILERDTAVKSSAAENA